MAAQANRRRILHILGSMCRGGVETWLMNILRHIDRDRFEMHFFVNSRSEGDYDREIHSLGGQLYYGGHPREPVRYAREFATLIRKRGPFDVVHSHVYWYSGIVTKLAYQQDIPIRIAHSHTSSTAPAWKVHRRAYQVAMRSMIARYATHRVGASINAGRALFGNEAQRPFTLLYYGMDFTPFLQRPTRKESKQRLGIPPHRKVIGHVGRFVPVKNHPFILESFAEVLKSGVDAHLLLVGDGPCFLDVKRQIESKGLSDRCRLAGSQSNVVPFYSAMDVFALPSLWEGFGLVALEAQAVGIPVIASTTVPEDINALRNMVEHIPLSAGAVEWARVIIRRLEESNACSGEEPVLLQNSRFGLPVCLQTLSQIYLGQNN